MPSKVKGESCTADNHLERTCKGVVGQKTANPRSCTRILKKDAPSDFCWQHTTTEIHNRTEEIPVAPKREIKKPKEAPSDPLVKKLTKKTPRVEEDPTPKEKKHRNSAETLRLLKSYPDSESKVIAKVVPKPELAESEKSNPFSSKSFQGNFATDEMLEFFGDDTQYQKLQDKLLEVVSAEAEECPHTKLLEVEDRSVWVCRDCGCTVENLDFHPEWRNYPSDARSGRDGSRCHRSKTSTKGGIDNVFEQCKLHSIPLSIRAKTEAKYKIVVQNETVRGVGRKSIVAACLLYTYRDEGDLRCASQIQKMFNLERKHMTKGITLYLAAFPEERVNIPTPKDLLFSTMKKVNIDISHYKTLIRISKCLDGVDTLLNRSSPQSVAAAIIYMYICLNPDLKKSLDMTKTKFAKHVDLSDITIGKLVKRSVEILSLQTLDDI